MKRLYLHFRKAALPDVIHDFRNLIGSTAESFSTQVAKCQLARQFIFARQSLNPLTFHPDAYQPPLSENVTSICTIRFRSMVTGLHLDSYNGVLFALLCTINPNFHTSSDIVMVITKRRIRQVKGAVGKKKQKSFHRKFL